jgi:hypothetical protein
MIIANPSNTGFSSLYRGSCGIGFFADLEIVRLIFGAGGINVGAALFMFESAVYSGYPESCFWSIRLTMLSVFALVLLADPHPIYLYIS